MTALPPEPNNEPAPEAKTPRVQRWNSPSCPFGIDSSADVLTKIRQRSVEALHALPHGGLEIGGVLFGRVYPNARSPLRIEIAAERAIACDHHNGPAFLLTEEERAQIGAQLERTRLDPELSALSVIGFWVSHSRGELALAQPDLDIYKLFPNPWQIALVLKPQPGLPVRAAFFYRNGNQISPPDPRYEFYTDPHLNAPAPEPAPTPAEKYKPVDRQRLAASIRNEPIPAEAIPNQARPEKSIGYSLAAFLIMVAMLVGASLTYGLQLLGKRIAAPPPDPLNVELFPSAQSVLVHWNARAAGIQNAHRGSLQIGDGTGRREIPLTPALLKQGFVILGSFGKSVPVTLTVIEQNGRIEKAAGHYAVAQ